MSAVSASQFHQIPDSLWNRIEPLLPRYKTHCKTGGRPRLPLRNVVTGILYVLRTGCQWKAMPQEFGSGSAIHAYYQDWVLRGVFEKLWRVSLEEYDARKGIDWEWQSLDGALNKSPLGGENNRQKPDRSWQDWGQAFGLDRWSRRSDWSGRGRSQRARPEIGEGNVGQCSLQASQADAA